MPRLNLQTKYILAISALIIFTSLIMSVYFIFQQIDIHNKYLDKNAKMLIRNLAYSSEDNVASSDINILDTIITNFLNEDNVAFVGILDLNRKFMVFESKNNLPENILPDQLKRVINPEEFKISNFLIYKNLDSELMEKLDLTVGPEKYNKFQPKPFIMVSPIYKENFSVDMNAPQKDILAYAVMAFSENNFEVIIHDTFLVTFIITFYVILIGILVTILLTNRIVKPIKELMYGTEKIAEGNYDYKVNINIKNEIGVLANSFNLMAEKIQQAKEKLDNTNLILEQKVIERTKALELNNIKIKEALAKANESDRLKSEFLTNMSHELRTPLNAIIGFSDVLIQGLDGELNEQQLEDLDLINKSGSRLLGLINNILDISKIEAGKMELVYEKTNLVEFVEELSPILQRQLEDKEIKLSFDVPETLPLLEVDRNQFKQIVLNLLSNAVKFTIKGEISLGVKQQKNYCLFEIKDTGVGIRTEDIPKIFERFRQVDGSTSRSQGGTGLGMALVKELVKLHNGKIWAESVYGQGTTFYFTIPINKDVEIDV